MERLHAEVPKPWRVPDVSCVLLRLRENIQLDGATM